MTPLDRLSSPIIAAPMAGGVSTPALVRAAAAAGGVGFLPAGYLAPSTVEAQLRQVTGLFGLNIFLPDGVTPDRLAVAAYRELLQDEFGQSLPEPPPAHDDHWESKLDIAIGLRVPLVSFTFACPPASAVARLHAAETFVIATVTTTEEALAAAEAGVDALCLQGAGAGAHRGSFAEQTNTKSASGDHKVDHKVDREGDNEGDHSGAPAGRTPRADGHGSAGAVKQAELPEMVSRLRDTLKLPVIAAGGIATPAHVRAVLEAGAVAAQIGTALLRTPESGAHPVHKAALVDPAFTATTGPRPAMTVDPRSATTTVTRAFTGRPARALRNEFTVRFDGAAPWAYPEIHYVTKPLRDAAAARGDAGAMALWAGINHAMAQARPAAEVIAHLAEAKMA